MVEFLGVLANASAVVSRRGSRGITLLDPAEDAPAIVDPVDAAESAGLRECLERRRVRREHLPALGAHALPAEVKLRRSAEPRVHLDYL